MLLIQEAAVKIRFISRILILLVVVFTSARYCYAHDTNAAIIDLKKVASQDYTLHIRTPLFRLDEAVRLQTKSGDKLVFNSNAYKHAIAVYIKDNLRLNATQRSENDRLVNRAIKVVSTKLKLGGHETNIILHLEDMDADEITSLDVSAKLMTQNPLQKNIIRFMDQKKSQSVFLHKDNAFSATISSFD